MKEVALRARKKISRVKGRGVNRALNVMEYKILKDMR